MLVLAPNPGTVTGCVIFASAAPVTRDRVQRWESSPGGQLAFKFRRLASRAGLIAKPAGESNKTLAGARFKFDGLQLILTVWST